MRAPAWARLLATWFGSGLCPFAPGTAGTVAALPLAWLLGRLPSAAAWNSWCLAASAALFLPAVRAATLYEAELGEHDPGPVVIDEVLGLLLTMAFLPAAAFADPRAYLAAFLLFRLLDIWKPGLVHSSQALPRGWGIVVDDVLAGLLGGALLGAAWRLLPLLDHA